jgi:ABC-2 type transport system ATP-binding protein
MDQQKFLRFPTARRRDPEVDGWMHAHPGELGAIAQHWFDVIRACGDDVRELLQAVDLEKFAKSLVSTFSGGMRRRLEVARGLVHSPKILFLDEPTTGLDPVSRTNVWEMIAKLKREAGYASADRTIWMRRTTRRPDRHRRPRATGALDTPVRLKDSVPGTDVVEPIEGALPNWHEILAHFRKWRG